MTEAKRVAEMAQRKQTSADLLLAMIRVGGAAARFLSERSLTAATVETVWPQAHFEPSFDGGVLLADAEEIAAGFAAKATTSLHVLLAMLRGNGSAIDLVRLTGNDPIKLRALVMRALTGPGPKHDRHVARSALVQVEPRAISSAAQTAQPAPRTLAHPASNSEARSAPTALPEKTDSPLGPAMLGFSPLYPPDYPVLFREREVGRLLDILGTHAPRILAVVGESGEGRTTVVSALASVEGLTPVYPTGDLGSPPSMGALLQAMHASAPAQSPIVLESSAWLGPEGSDASLQLVATAAAGRKWILTLTPADIRRIECEMPALAENLEQVRLCPPPLAQLLEMIDLGVGTLLNTTPIEFEENLAPFLYRLSPHYPSERAQPGRAIAIAEIAMARAHRLGKTRVEKADVAMVVADASGASLSQLLRDDDERYQSLERRLASRVIGHEKAREKIADVLRRGYAGFRGKRPLASFLLLGPTGVGKTETARAIAEALFDSESALLRIDLSEFSEPHAVARLVGSPPGYLGHEQGGQLTEAVRRRPAQVVLFDEMEKAHRDVLLLLLQVLEDGRLTDGRGRTADFSSSVIVLTSNLGSECYRHPRIPSESTILALARSRLPPELWNRIDEILCYSPLSEKDLGDIVIRIAQYSSERLWGERKIRFQIDASIVAAVLEAEPDRSLGARPLRRAFERMVEGPIANEIVAGKIRSGHTLQIRSTADHRLDIRVLRPSGA